MDEIIYDTPTTYPVGEDVLPTETVTVACRTLECPGYGAPLEITTVVGSIIVCGQCGNPVAAAGSKEEA